MWCILPGLAVLAIIWTVYYLKGYAPFGIFSVATDDCNYQYLDFLAYLKDVFARSNGIGYSFGKMLGGPCIGLFSYYLSSPFNFLVLLFPKAELVNFVDLVVSLKLAAAGITCVVFLNESFQKNSQNSLFRHVLMGVLSVGYALSQYSIAQASNIMWLDGVYMLPLILLGVTRLAEGKGGTFLSVSVALSILFNWYTGGINCCFAILWMGFELLLYIEAGAGADRPGDIFKECVVRILAFGWYVLLGVLISGVLFFPTVAVMRKGVEGDLEFTGLLNPGFWGNPLNVMEGFVPGAKSTQTSVSLYCGAFAMVGYVGFFLSRQMTIRKKLVYLSFSFLVLLTFYWKPLYHVFSLFKPAYSYQCRFSYTGILTLIFVAASFYSSIRFPDGQHRLVICCVLLIGAAALVEAGYNVCLELDNYHSDNAHTYAAYSREKESQIGFLKEYDQEMYRISDLAIRDKRENGLAAAYNEAMAYNYWSVSGYTSSPDSVSIDFLDRLGYRREDVDLNITNTSILAADSLLGVKYVLSRDEINGLVPLDFGEVQGDKRIYSNPFALPMALRYTPKWDDRSNVHNSFEYMNYLYSVLYGEKCDVFIPLNYELECNQAGSLSYHVAVPEGNYGIYGNLPWDHEYDGMLDLNGRDRTAYARWLSPSVFYIPTNKGDTSCYVSLSSANPIESNGAEQFYALDLDLLHTVSSALQKKKADLIDIRNGYIYIYI